jgi:hypothetical protein
MLYPFKQFQGPLPERPPPVRMVILGGHVMVHVFWKIWKLQNPELTAAWPDDSFTHLCLNYYWRSK